MAFKAAHHALAIGLLISGSAHSALFDRGSGLIYDDDLDITWQQRPSSVWTTWGSAMDWAANLSYFDSVRNVTLGDWRLPSQGEFSHLYFDEFRGQRGIDIRYPPSANYLLFDNIQPYQYWTANTYPVNPLEYAQVFNFYLGQEYSLNKFNQYAMTWAVMNGDVGTVSSVPEPSPLSYMLTGLLAIAAVARRGISSSPC